MVQEKNWNKNQILLHGTISKVPSFSHSSHGTDYYLFPFSVSRLSGTQDQVKVMAAASLLEQSSITCGDTLTVAGEIRSFNNHHGSGRRLVISVHAHTLIREEGEDVNSLKLAGTLCKHPIHRRTPLGRDICDMMLAVNRSYGRTDYLPCISWGALAQRCGSYTVGTPLTIEGRLQSRVYTKKLEEGSQERTAFEISVADVTIVEEQ